MDMDRIDADYVAIPELDTYDGADLDRREYDNMDFSDRRAAERELAERYSTLVHKPQARGFFAFFLVLHVTFSTLDRNNHQIYLSLALEEAVPPDVV